jgi:hypothetical protein
MQGQAVQERSSNCCCQNHDLPGNTILSNFVMSLIPEQCSGPNGINVNQGFQPVERDFSPDGAPSTPAASSRDLEWYATTVPPQESTSGPFLNRLPLHMACNTHEEDG